MPTYLLALSLATLQTPNSISPESLTIQPPTVAEIASSGPTSVVKWSVPCDSVDVAFGDSISSFGPSTTVRGADSAPDPNHPFARLRFHGGPFNHRTLTVGERFVSIDGAANFRDLGGYRTDTGKVTKWGLMYRSNALDQLDDADLAKFVSLTIRKDFDLRGDGEVKSAPDHVPSNVTYIRLPIEGRLPAGGPKDTTRPFGEAMLGALYVQMVDDKAATVYGPWLKALAREEKPEPFVIHCTAGKDRTGVGSALLLTLLGVPRETVVADYSLTNMTYHQLVKSLATHGNAMPTGMNNSSLGQLILAFPGSLTEMLDHVNSKYGSVEAYALGPCGLTRADIARLRKIYLE